MPLKPSRTSGMRWVSAAAPYPWRAALPFSPHFVEVPMGKLALFLGGFLMLTILIGLLGTIPPG